MNKALYYLLIDRNGNAHGNGALKTPMLIHSFNVFGVVYIRVSSAIRGLTKGESLRITVYVIDNNSPFSLSVRAISENLRHLWISNGLAIDFIHAPLSMQHFIIFQKKVSYV